MDSFGAWLFGLIIGVAGGVCWVGSHDHVVVVKELGGVDIVEWNSQIYKLSPVEIKTSAEEEAKK